MITEKKIFSIRVFFVFRGIMEVLGLMKLDMANFNIRQYRPLLQQQAVAYEKSTFEKFMENQRGFIFLNLKIIQNFLDLFFSNGN